MVYSPKYIQSFDEIPVQIPDDYSQDEKGDALEFAEASLELDLNGGQEFTQSNVTEMMRVAVKQKATCELARSAEHPNDVTLGDLEDTGSEITDFAETFCDRYNEIVDKIIDNTDIGSGTTDPYTYTTSPPSEQ